MKNRCLLTCSLLAGFALAIGSCSKTQDQRQTVTLATTTSTRDSGLLDVLVPLFEKQTGIEVKVLAVGTGQALAIGRRGDADVLLTHAPDAEKQFVEEGHGERRLPVMQNDFVVVGPTSVPAELTHQTSIADLLRYIARSETRFVSRGDDSGTHLKELQLWKDAQVDPHGDWYIQAGAGMAAALRLASEKQACTLADRGTYLALREQLDLIILFEGDPLLRNPYAVIVVSAAKHPHVNLTAARRFSEFLLSRRIQRIIGEFGVKSFGQRLFFPLLDNTTDSSMRVRSTHSA